MPLGAGSPRALAFPCGRSCDRRPGRAARTTCRRTRGELGHPVRAGDGGRCRPSTSAGLPPRDRLRATPGARRLAGLAPTACLLGCPGSRTRDTSSGDRGIRGRAAPVGLDGRHLLGGAERRGRSGIPPHRSGSGGGAWRLGVGPARNGRSTAGPQAYTRGLNPRQPPPLRRARAAQDPDAPPTGQAQPTAPDNHSSGSTNEPPDQPSPPRVTSKCRCAPKELPVSPTAPT